MKDDTARLTSGKSWQDGLAQLALDLCRAVPGGERVVLHGSAVHGADPGDVDLAIIVRDGTDRFEAVRTIAGLLADRSVATGVLHTCFPIEQEACSFKASQYVRNVLTDGREL
ncbi:hypothetical protein LPN01_18325 [Sphingomonas sp. A2-49]|uniref:hypothetical protein n=1 Tax=Sphingomonas sp. A2-49 TaxID=1391375 RepID=UPI0021D36C7D|nr:hypothetical protein [Sphingomonas sp. A2-49]MCU6456038.1 hypothetical protein [Sphingomonas sp. A2-49]